MTIQELNEIIENLPDYIEGIGRMKPYFNNGKEMLDELEWADLYNPETGEYVFSYNDIGSIAVYNLSTDEVKELREETKNTGESWSAFLGAGGYIYDNSIEWCNERYKENWEYA